MKLVESGLTLITRPLSHGSLQTKYKYLSTNVYFSFVSTIDDSIDTFGNKWIAGIYVDKIFCE